MPFSDISNIERDIFLPRENHANCDRYVSINFIYPACWNKVGLAISFFPFISISRFVPS